MNNYLWYDNAAAEIVDMVNRTPFTENAVSQIIMKHIPADEPDLVEAMLN